MVRYRSKARVYTAPTAAREKKRQTLHDKIEGVGTSRCQRCTAPNPRKKNHTQQHLDEKRVYGCADWFMG